MQQDLDAQLARLETLGELQKSIPERIRVGNLRGKDALDVLPAGERLLPDILRMIAGRAETVMMRADADIVPDHGRGELRVRVLGTASDAGEKHVRELLEELTRTGTCFPETNPRLAYETCGWGIETWR